MRAWVARTAAWALRQVADRIDPPAPEPDPVQPLRTVTFGDPDRTLEGLALELWGPKGMNG